MTKYIFCYCLSVRSTGENKRAESPGGPWKFVGLLPLFDPPRHDSVDTISKALKLGINVNMIIGNAIPYFFNLAFLFLFPLPTYK